MTRSPRQVVTGLAMALGAVAGLVAPVGAQSRPARDLPKPFAKYSDAAMAMGDSLLARTVPSPVSGDAIVARARTEIGTRYRLGAATPGKAFDCSGFVRWVLSAFDVSLPRTSREQARLGEELPRDTAHLKPGDLLTFGSKTRISHVGIYVGEGRYIHASSARRGVTESSLLKDDKRGWWRGARRVVPVAPDTAAVVPTSGR